METDHIALIRTSRLYSMPLADRAGSPPVVADRPLVLTPRRPDARRTAAPAPQIPPGEHRFEGRHEDVGGDVTGHMNRR